MGSDGGGAQVMYGGCITLCICPKTIKLYNTKGDPRVNYGLELMIPYQHWFINCNKCTLMQDVNKRGNGVRERGGYMGLCIIFLIFCKL